MKFNKDKKTIIKLSLLIISLPILVLFSSFQSSVNGKILDLFYKIKGEDAPDSSVVIIHISEKDIEELGHWPLKRSYYALLARELNNYKVKAIGLEIFLSQKFTSQSIYDELLLREINKAGNVVLSLLVSDLKPNGNKLEAVDTEQSLAGGEISNGITFGHLNYIDDDGIFVPSQINFEDTVLYSFSEALLNKFNGFANKKQNELIKINFLSGWKKFKNYSLLGFFDKVKTNDAELDNLRNKIVLIGVSDPQFSKKIASPFDDQLPGVALHAFAIDNLLNNREINFDLKFISAFVFSLFLFPFLFFRYAKKIATYTLFPTAAFLIFFFLFASFLIELNYAFFFFPFFVLAGYEIVDWLILTKTELDEAKKLKLTLESKEKELMQLENELNIKQPESSGEGSSELLEKIRSLKEEIETLHEKEKDFFPAAFVSEDNSIEKDFFGIVYRSKIMDRIIKIIEKAAPEEAVILITGESGTGKELAAKAVHQLSKRRDEKFVALNCGALSETLLESELFGYVKGAFTGAGSNKIGMFEAADKGTIFLDEIGETSENFQMKLLRILQTGDFRQVGSTETRNVNVRVVAATNKNLEELVEEKKFREDLYYRLNVIKIELPPLRERSEDIEPIVKKILSREENNLQISGLAMDILKENEWRGNVRELESVVKRALIFAKSEKRKLIQLRDLPDELVNKKKEGFDQLVLGSLRGKNFSHSSIAETAKELGDVNRNLVSENFRGLCIKAIVENNFDLNKAASQIAGNNDGEMIKRIYSRMKTFLKNIEQGIDIIGLTDNADVIRDKLNSKYKNLPQKFRIFLDDIIIHLKRKAEKQ